MKIKIYLFLSVSILMIGCKAPAPTIDSNLYHANSNKPYKNILIALPIEKLSLSHFSEELKNNLQHNLSINHTRVEFVSYVVKKDFSSLQTYREIKKSHNDKTDEDAKDLIIVFQSLNINNDDSADRGTSSRSGFRSFKIVATDTKTNTDCWVGNVNSSDVLTKSTFAKEISDLIYLKLKTDGII